MPVKNNKIIEVCSACLTASCWYGEFMCDESRSAGTVKLTVKELREKQGWKEHEENWGVKKMKAVYGDPNPFGCKLVE